MFFFLAILQTRKKNTAKNKSKKRIFGAKNNQKLLELIWYPGQTWSKLPVFS